MVLKYGDKEGVRGGEVMVMVVGLWDGEKLVVGMEVVWWQYGREGDGRRKEEGDRGRTGKSYLKINKINGVLTS